MKRMKREIMGRIIGTATGWDQQDTFIIALIDFEPAAGVDLPTTEFLTINFEEGFFQTHDEVGVVVLEKDIIETIKNVNRIK